MFICVWHSALQKSSDTASILPMRVLETVEYVSKGNHTNQSNRKDPFRMLERPTKLYPNAKEYVFMLIFYFFFNVSIPKVT